MPSFNARHRLQIISTYVVLDSTITTATSLRVCPGCWYLHLVREANRVSDCTAFHTMRGRNLRPVRVYQAATQLLETRAIAQPPPWYTTIGSVPPGEILTRVQPPQHRDTRPHKRARKPSKLFQPQYLEYEEDQLRREFYKDHPWELARPRIVLEVDGKDAQGQDWSMLRQKGKAISGEK